MIFANMKRKERSVLGCTIVSTTSTKMQLQLDSNSKVFNSINLPIIFSTIYLNLTSIKYNQQIYISKHIKLYTCLQKIIMTFVSIHRYVLWGLIICSNYSSILKIEVSSLVRNTLGKVLNLFVFVDAVYYERSR